MGQSQTPPAPLRRLCRHPGYVRSLQGPAPAPGPIIVIVIMIIFIIMIVLIIVIILIVMIIVGTWLRSQPRGVG